LLKVIVGSLHHGQNEMNIHFIIIVVIVLGLIIMGIVLKMLAEMLSNRQYTRAHKRWSAFRRMGLLESGYIIKVSRMDQIRYGSMK